MNVRPHRIPALVLAAAAASSALAACAASSSTAHDQRAFSLGGTRLVINDTASDLQVVPGNGPGIDCSGLVFSFSCGSRFEVAGPPGVAVTVKCSTGNATGRVSASGHQYDVLVSSGTGTASSKVPDDPQAGNVVRVSSGNDDATVLPAS